MSLTVVNVVVVMVVVVTVVAVVVVTVVVVVVVVPVVVVTVVVVVVVWVVLVVVVVVVAVVVVVVVVARSVAPAPSALVVFGAALPLVDFGRVVSASSAMQTVGANDGTLPVVLSGVNGRSTLDDGMHRMHSLSSETAFEQHTPCRHFLDRQSASVLQ